MRGAKGGHHRHLASEEKRAGGQASPLGLPVPIFNGIGKHKKERNKRQSPLIGFQKKEGENSI